MVTVLSPPSDQRVVLDNIDWETYERILEAHKDCSVPRFTYDRGRLEVRSPSPEHEELKHTAATLIELWASEWNVDSRGLGSTTFRREDLKRGFEPDSCFYVQSVERMRGKNEIDLTIDPPPDLVIEVDITSPSIKKFPLFAQLGVPEVWRYEGERWHIFLFEGGEYVEREESFAMPGLSAAVITRFVDEGRSLHRPEWVRRVRDWAQQLRGQNT